VLDGNVSQFSVGARAFREMGGFDWGILGAFSHASSDFDSLVAGQAQAQSAEESINMWMLGLGPVWNDEPENWQVAGYVTLESQSREFDSPANPAAQHVKTDQRFFTFPGVRIAAERRLWRTSDPRRHGPITSSAPSRPGPAATTGIFDRAYRFQGRRFSTRCPGSAFECVQRARAHHRTPVPRQQLRLSGDRLDPTSGETP
jgi:hypothetical protein